METIWLKPSELKRYEKNAKVHTKKQIAHIAESIRRFGFKQPIVANSDREVVIGHGRLEAAELLGLDTVPVWLDSKLTPEEIRLLRLADNSIQAETGMDPALLADELADLLEASVEIESLGLSFDPPELEPSAPDEEPLPTPPEKPVTRPGDVWNLGGHRIFCGDCSLGRLPFDLTSCMVILTDPPYSSGAFQDAGKALSTSIGSTGAERITRDNLSTRGYLALIKQALSIFPGHVAYLFTDWRMWCWTFEALESSGLAMRNMLVWDKLTPGMGAVWRAQHELIAFAHRTSDKLGWGTRGNVLQCKRSGNEFHPTQKPTDLLIQILENSEAGDVYDPFLGSGSTLIAAHACGRKCFGVEIMPAFCDATILRWQQLTGEDAVIASYDETHQWHRLTFSRLAELRSEQP
jgi:DNA modification methylase